MVEPWITAETVQQSMQRNGIRLTGRDAEAILAQLDQPGTFAKHESRVAVAVWDGKPVNGVDMRNHEGTPPPPKAVLIDGQSHQIQEQIQERLKPKNTSHQFLTRHEGLAFTTTIDGKLVGFQPHAPVAGWHAMTSKAISCDCGKTHESCPTCKGEHDITEAMLAHYAEVVKGLAGTELQTRVLYLAQEIHDRRLEALDRLAAAGGR